MRKFGTKNTLLQLVWHEYTRRFIVLSQANSRLLVSVQRYFSVVINLKGLHSFL